MEAVAESRRSTWSALVAGDGIDLQNLAHAMTTPALKVRQDGGNFWIESTLFDGAPDPQNVEAIAWRLVDAASVQVAARGPLTVGSIYEAREDGSVIAYAKGVAASRSSGQAIPAGVDVSALTAKLATDTRDDVKDALQFWNRTDRGWGDLYKVFELVRHAVGGERIIKLAGPHLEQFTKSANDWTKLDTRHSRPKPRKSKRPKSPTARRPTSTMTLDAARSFVFDLLRQWLAMKGN